MERDEDLYLKVKAGDLGAFDVLYERYRTGLFSFIYSYLKNREESEEIFHETFLNVLKSPEVHFEKGSFKGWMYLIARNSALNRIRSRMREEKAREEKAREEKAFSDPSEEPVQGNMETEIFKRDLTQKLRVAADKMPGHLLEVYRLWLTGLKHREIAQSLQIPVGTVKSRFHNLVEYLKMELNP